MDKSILDKLICLHGQIRVLANAERFGADYKDYPPNINRFEFLVHRFYEVASNQTMPADILQHVLDGKSSLNKRFMYLHSKMCFNKFEEMRFICSEIDQITNGLIEYENNK